MVWKVCQAAPVKSHCKVVGSSKNAPNDCDLEYPDILPSKTFDEIYCWNAINKQWVNYKA